jgi:hypothetical protein
LGLWLIWPAPEVLEPESPLVARCYDDFDKAPDDQIDGALKAIETCLERAEGTP